MIARLRAEPLLIPQLLMLLSYWLGGISMLFGGIPSSVLDQLGSGWHQAWVAMLLLGPPLSMAGVWWRDQWVGTLIRIAGGCLVSPALGVYLVGIWRSFGAGTFAVWLTAGLSLATVVLLVRDIATFARIERAVKGA